MTQYEIDCAAREAAERKATAEFHAKVKAIAPLLGGTYEARRHEGKLSRFAEIKLPFGGTIHIASDWRGTDKCNVSGEWPRTAKGEVQAPYFSAYSNDVKRPDIGVSFSRSAEAIAKDIARRFIPAYVLLYEEQVRRVNASNDYAQKTAANQARLAKALGDLDNVGGEASGDSVSIKFTGTIEQVEKIAALIRSLQA